MTPDAAPARRTPLPYGRQTIDEDDVAAVVAVLRSDWLTTGPRVAAFERAVADYVGAAEAVALSSGTAALHSALYALGVGPGDEVLVPALTFAASANCALYQGATPVFVDVDPDTLLMDPAAAAGRVTPRTRALVAVDYAGQPCDYDALHALARRHRLALVADACHALGGAYRGRRVGTLAALSTFSFHPVKPIATAEGGMVTTDDPELARRMRVFRNHGITTDHRQRAQAGSWSYEMVDLGFNYRLSDLQCALGASQLRKLPGWVRRRQEIAHRYDAAFAGLSGVRPLAVRPEVSHAYHLYVVRLADAAARQRAYAALRAGGIGANVHYVPVHLHPYYHRRLGTAPGLCPVAEAAAERILSLPIFPSMSDADADDVIRALAGACGAASSPPDPRSENGAAA
jgi:perosamine synthetase